MSITATRRYLVAGGAGFLGSHLCEALLDAGHDVICIDNVSTGSRHNISHLLTHPGFEWIRHDVTTPIALQADAIFNLACPASPIKYQRDPVHTIRTSVEGALCLLDLARNLSVPIVQASTSEVYGDPEEHPQTERYWGRVNPIGPRSGYDEGKRCAETLFSDYRRAYAVDTRIARIFNTYGPRMEVNDGRVVSTFIVQALRNEPITIQGDGSHTRSFCYVSDTIAGLMRLMNASPDFGGPVNIGNPAECTISELAETIVAMTHSSSTIIHVPPATDDPTRRKPDIRLARSKLGWWPEVDLQSGLHTTIEHFADIIGRPLATRVA